jgi:hypothetical protein
MPNLHHNDTPRRHVPPPRRLPPYNGEIKFLDSRKPGERVSGDNDAPRERAMAGAGAGGDLDDEIPF